MRNQKKFNGSMASAQEICSWVNTFKYIDEDDGERCRVDDLNKAHFYTHKEYGLVVVVNGDLIRVNQIASKI